MMWITLNIHGIAGRPILSQLISQFQCLASVFTTIQFAYLLGPTLMAETKHIGIVGVN